MNKLFETLRKDTRLQIPYSQPVQNPETDPALPWAELLPGPAAPSPWRYAATAAGTVVLAGGVLVFCLSSLQNAGDPVVSSSTDETFLVTTPSTVSTVPDTTGTGTGATTQETDTEESRSTDATSSTTTAPTTKATTAIPAWNPSDYINAADVVCHRGICQKDGWIYRIEDSETNISTDTVIKIRPDGSEKQTVFTLSEAGAIRNLQIIGQWFYYKANFKEDGRLMTGIYRTRLDGTDTQCLLYHDASSEEMFIDGLFIYDLIYPYTDEWKNQPSENVVLYRYRLDGTKKEEVCNFTHLGYELDRPNIRIQDGYLYFTDYQFPEDVYTINRINLSDQTVSVIREWGPEEFRQKNIFFEIDNGWLYFYEKDIGIKRIRLDGSEESVIFSYPPNEKNVHMEVYVRNNVLYAFETYSRSMFYIPVNHPEQMQQMALPYDLRNFSILDGRLYCTGTITKFQYENGKKVVEKFTGIFFSTNYKGGDLKELYRKEHPPEYSPDSKLTIY